MQPHIREQRERVKRRERRRSRLVMAVLLAFVALFLAAQYIWMGKHGMGSAARIAIIAASTVSACTIVGWVLYRRVFKQDN